MRFWWLSMAALERIGFGLPRNASRCAALLLCFSTSPCLLRACLLAEDWAGFSLQTLFQRRASAAGPGPWAVLKHSAKSAIQARGEAKGHAAISVHARARAHNLHARERTSQRKKRSSAGSRLLLGLTPLSRVDGTTRGSAGSASRCV